MTSSERGSRRKTLVFGPLLLALVVSGSVVWGLVHSANPDISHPTMLQGSGSSAFVSAPAAPSGSSGNNGNTDPNTGCNSSGQCNGHDNTFGVTVGNVTRLYPGATRSLAVTYTNPNSFAINVVSATVTPVLTPGKSGCYSSDLTVPAYSSSTGLTVPRNGSTSTTFPVTMKASAADGCKNATWTLTVAAQAVK